jgi:hypothetical protein
MLWFFHSCFENSKFMLSGRVNSKVNDNYCIQILCADNYTIPMYAENLKKMSDEEAMLWKLENL